MKQKRIFSGVNRQCNELCTAHGEFMTNSLAFAGVLRGHAHLKANPRRHYTLYFYALWEYHICVQRLL